jgi:methyl coenzyme M reductase subunit D
MKKLQTYKIFETGGHPNDHNYETEIDAILEKLVEQKIYVSMLRDSINQVSQMIEEVFPDDMDTFMGALTHYEESISDKVEMIKQNMIDGYPNLKDLIEELENDISDIEDYLEEKKAKEINNDH